MNNGIKLRIIKNSIFKILVILVSFILVIPLFLIFFYIFKMGISSINIDFLINLPKPVGETGGGVSNAIIGTFMLIILSSIVSVPLGIAAGVFLSENRSSKLAGITSSCIEIIQGVPSIVIGIIAYVWVVKPMGSFTALSGSIALAIIMLPVIVKSTEETLILIPHSLKEAALSLGVPYYKVIIRVILPSGLSGILTGILLSLARISGETAPLLFTAFGNPFMNLNLLKPVNSLPLLIFNYAASPYPEWHSIAWGASFVLIALVLVLNLTAKGIARKWKVQF
ncbi:MAG: phosphate ABC transporter permease PstA [Candidatus Coatesbacteria bacterium]|nr:phosphate ABC transporter permease PstA [Candidatus Coatesbacteria bacterium]